MAQQNEIVAAARRFVEDILGKNNQALADEIVDAEIIYHTGFAQAPVRGRDAFKQAIQGLHVGFSGIRLTIEDAFAAADGERVVIRFNAPAVHTGDVMGVKATGKRINMIETHVIRVRNGKIVEDYASDNVLDFGVLIAPAFPDELPTQTAQKTAGQ